jgi:peptide/nickel transport system substrate-binding protein
MAEATPMPETGIKRGGRLRDILSTAMESLDPHTSSLGSATFFPLLYDSLLSYRLVDPETETFEIGPGLAESYEVIDPTTLEFKLRQDVKFHDGSDFNAAVAKWNLDRAATHPESKVNETLSSVEEVEVVDDYTLRLHLTAPAPLLPLQLTPANDVNVYFVSQQAIEDMGEEAFASNPVGSGPLKFKEWIRDDRLILEKFPDHWEIGEDGQPLPYYDEFESRLITDQTVAMVEMRTGNMDVQTQMLLQDVETVEGDPNLKTWILPGQWKGYPSLYFNPNPPSDAENPFSANKALREAAQYATDHESVAKALGFGMGQPHYYWGWYPGVPGYDESLPRREFDLEKAKQLVIEAGYPDGVDIDVKVINRQTDTQPLEVVQAMWDKAGIRMNINLMDRLPWIDDGRAGNFEALSHGNTARVSPLLRQETKTGSTYNWAGYSNPEVDKLWEQASSEYDQAKRNEIYKEIQKLMYDDAYHFVAYRYPRVVALNQRVQDYTTEYNYRYVWLDE